MTRSGYPGAFITFEGGEGAGKSTQLRAVAPRLEALGYEVLATREPGGSPGAEAIRNLLLFGEEDLSVRAEIMAHFAARCDHIDTMIRPALESGKIVLCDRFSDSTLAYQGYGRGHGDPALLAFIRSLRDLAGLSPDLTILFEISPEQGRRRITERAGVTDRYEQAGIAFHERLTKGFDAIARAEPDRFARIESGDADIATITDRVVERIRTFLEKR